MKAKYDGKWYETLTFTQETVRFNADEPDTSIWYEVLSIPGRLRIDIAPADSGNGLLFVDDHRYVFQNGELVFERPEIHPLLVLGFDIYHAPVEETLAKIDSLGIDINAMHESEWDGRPAYVVGTVSGDLDSAQFWVDKERLVFVRLLQPAQAGDGVVEIRFEDYEPVGEAWLAPKVEFFLDGSLMLRETYHDVTIDELVSDSLFDPVMWKDFTDWATDG
ncbi:MAG: hypothetical protein KJO98_03780 [Rhodothermia bacterium]|nr:hypothetical protein [Rhodothermia bacterium]